MDKYIATICICQSALLLIFLSSVNKGKYVKSFFKPFFKPFNLIWQCLCNTVHVSRVWLIQSSSNQISQNERSSANADESLRHPGVINNNSKIGTQTNQTSYSNITQVACDQGRKSFGIEVGGDVYGDITSIGKKFSIMCDTDYIKLNGRIYKKCNNIYVYEENARVHDCPNMTTDTNKIYINNLKYIRNNKIFVYKLNKY